MDYIRNDEASSSRRINEEKEDNNGRFMDGNQDPYLFNAPPNGMEGNSKLQRKKNSLQKRLNNIYYKSTPNKPYDSHHSYMNSQASMATISTNHLNCQQEEMMRSKQVVVNYSIHDYSSYSGSYLPDNIRFNKPSQQSSRWSSGLHDHEQYITIQFNTPIIARTITFGKFHKGHVCNLKEFKVYGGMESTQGDMIELVHTGLKNDTEAETFLLKYQQKNMIFPVKYIKIVPLAAFGANFNYSIWYIEVRGIVDESILQRICSEYNYYKEVETTRLCLKYFRQKNMMDIFGLLKKKTQVEIEHPYISRLHDSLVIQNNFNAAEDILTELYQQDIFNEFTENSMYKSTWKEINTKDFRPVKRGGHQMCIDIQDEIIYILGGWNGKRDLSDFWSFDIRSNQWRCISMDTQLQGGPSPRSCHKICFDAHSKSIFVLGKYADSNINAANKIESDFYRYYIEFDQWIKISHNTANEGGPKLLFDHQMSIDSKGEVLYVFGGKNIIVDQNSNGNNSNNSDYSGLYSYNIKLNQWKLLRKGDDTLKSRVGHSMLINGNSLYILAGQRGKDYFSDLNKYNIDMDMVHEIKQKKDCLFLANQPDLGFTQRATLDEALQEIYVFTGYMKPDTVKNALWVYSINRNEWKKVYQSSTNNVNEPCPRFAHQMVYNEITKTHYIFGGSPGDQANPSKRLNDFWQLNLSKPEASHILNHCYYLTRMQKLRELTLNINNEEEEEYLMMALNYLRNQVAPLVNHQDETQLKEFHQMCANLCSEQQEMEHHNNMHMNDEYLKDLLYKERTRLFEKILEYIPQDMKEPLGKLTNAVKLL